MEQSFVDLTIIIVSWNVREHLDRCLQSSLGQPGVSYEVLVVDNASADQSADLVRERYPNVQLIANHENRGYARANNQAIAKARGKFLLLLNPDTVIHKGTLAATVKYLSEHPKVGILGCRIENEDGSLQRSVRRFPTLVSQIWILLKLHRFFSGLSSLKRYLALDFDYAREQDADQVMGAFFAFRRELLETVGTLDDGFFLWFEEVDFCRRAKNAGWLVRYVPSFAITHVGGESFGQLLSVEQQTFFNRSLLRYFRKHHSVEAWLMLLILTPLSLLLAFVEHFFRRWYAPESFR